MQGYDNSSYGEAFADVYDDWYADISDVVATVDALARMAATTAPLPIVELGVGTGRLALPLAEAMPGIDIFGIDSSPSMLAAAAAKGVAANVHLIDGDMVTGLATVADQRPLGLVFVAFNTFFNLGSAATQQACFDAVAARLAPGGRFVIEAFVPDEPARRGDHIEVKSLQTDRVVLSIARYDGQQHVEGQFVEFTESGGVRLRPWSIRYLTPDELDTMAAAAGLTLSDRWETFAGQPFDDDSSRHVSIFMQRE
ncbi:MAG: class I SAM-dependent methyltransferase [Ilumatobacteraceae bacterium]